MVSYRRTSAPLDPHVLATWVKQTVSYRRTSAPLDPHVLATWVNQMVSYGPPQFCLRRLGNLPGGHSRSLSRQPSMTGRGRSDNFTIQPL
jgi:hypothetical protein